jgi:methylmalonyl-CoA/ethylmalonyl-CoA epimerase
MKISQVDHVHIFQPELEKAANFYSNVMGCRFIETIDHSQAFIKVTFSDNGIEVVQPYGPNKFEIPQLMEKYGPGIGTVGFKVPEIESAIAEMESKGVELISRSSYSWRAPGEVDIKACAFRPETLRGLPVEFVEFQSATPISVAALNWIKRRPWKQEAKKPQAFFAERINHLNLYQNDLEAAVKFFSNLFEMSWIGPIEKPDLKLRIAYSDVGINIYQPTGDDRFGVSDLIKKRGEGVGSLGFKVPDIEAAIAELKSKGVRLIGRGEYADNPDVDLKVAAFDPETCYGLPLELVEFQQTAPVAIANLTWIQEMPWMET